jgi:hypothetical protein
MQVAPVERKANLEFFELVKLSHLLVVQRRLEVKGIDPGVQQAALPAECSFLLLEESELTVAGS